VKEVPMWRHSIVRVGLVVALSVVAGSGQAQPKGEKVTVKGEVVDLWCYLESGDRGPAKKQCATSCATPGNPIGVLDSTGNLYVAAGLTDHQPGKDVLVNHMSTEVTVTGTLLKKGGVHMLYVDSVT
jgi:hypothetical protein